MKPQVTPQTPAPATEEQKKAAKANAAKVAKELEEKKVKEEKMRIKHREFSLQDMVRNMV